MLSYGGAKTRRKGITSQGIQHHLVMGTVNVAMNGPRKSAWKRLARRSSVFIPVGESSSFIPQYKLENAKLPKFMILHFGRPRLIWDWIILVLVCYIAIMVPFNVAFKAHDHRKELIIADCIVEIFFIVDIFINFRTTYIDKKSGRIITQKKMIALHYLKRWFIVDFLAALPFEALYFIDHSWGFLVSLLKTGRLLRLFRIARRISRYIEYTAALLGLLMFSFAMLGHWFACVWYVIGYEEFKKNEVNGWLYGLGEQMGKPYVNSSLASGPSKGEAYISSLYFILTSLTTVGFGNIAPNTAAEKIFSVVVLLLGALMQSAIFGNMTAVIQKLYAVRARFHAKAAEIKQFVRLHRIENDLKRRIEDFFLTHWSVSKGVDSDEMLESFPSELRADICLHIYKNFLSLPCFSDASRGCWRLLSLKVKRAYFGPGELILKERDAIDAIFFVNSGTIEIVQKECIVAILGSGDLFGDDVSRRVPIRRSNGDVRALTYCDLLYLTRDNFLGVMHLYPDFAEAFSQKLEMTFNLGMKERDLSTCGALDSIIEGDEEEEEVMSESADDDLQEETSLLPDASSPPSPGLPLWQQQLRSRERGLSNPMPASPSLEERLMRITSDSSIDESTKETLEIEREFSCQSNDNDWSFRDGTDDIDGQNSSELGQRFVLPKSEVSISSKSEEKPHYEEFSETSFFDDKDEKNPSKYLCTVADIELTESNRNSYVDSCDQAANIEKDIDSLATSQTLLIATDDDELQVNETYRAVENHVQSKKDSSIYLERTEPNNIIVNTLPRLSCRRERSKHRYSLPELSGENCSRSEVSSSEKTIDVHRSSSMSNPRRKQCSVFRRPRINKDYTEYFETLPEDNVPDVSFTENILDDGTNTTILSDKRRNSSDMSWDMLCPAFEDEELQSVTQIENGECHDDSPRVDVNDLTLPKANIERLSSGIFSREFSDSDSDRESDFSGKRKRCNSSNNVRKNRRGAREVHCYANNDLNTSRRVSEPIFPIAARRMRKSMVDGQTIVEPSFGSAFISEMHQELTKEVRSTRKSLEGIEKALSISRSGNGLINVGYLAKDLAESKSAVSDVSNKIDRLSTDVIGLKKELKSLTALVRLLIEQQDSMR
ncbi:potassium voltage-gated channel subfamily H member 8-like isoform X2 [Rhopilema esculentum]|uniref:potassium voltage-gated channel subfamily H member 8-like isoform X2 n=1 Tax=Rhopilema esculentum TaxID=499914 RepID=UPI0031D3D447